MHHAIRRWGPLVAGTLLCLFLFSLVGGARAHADSTGEETGGAGDLAGEVFSEVRHNKIAINFIWVFLGAILVFFMQAGFAMVETGFTQERNTVHVMMTKFTFFAIGTLGYFLVGYALMFGGVGALTTLGGAEILNAKLEVTHGWSILGIKGFALAGSGVYDVGVFLFFLFQVVFMDTAATIVTGAMAERWRFKVFIVYGFFMSMVLYPVFGH